MAMHGEFAHTPFRDPHPVSVIRAPSPFDHPPLLLIIPVPLFSSCPHSLPSCPPFFSSFSPPFRHSRESGNPGILSRNSRPSASSPTAATQRCILQLAADLVERVREHRNNVVGGPQIAMTCANWSASNNTATSCQAVQREKQVKRWSRACRTDLIEQADPRWRAQWPLFWAAPDAWIPAFAGMTETKRCE